MCRQFAQEAGIWVWEINIYATLQKSKLDIKLSRLVFQVKWFIWAF